MRSTVPRPTPTSVATFSLLFPATTNFGGTLGLASFFALLANAIQASHHFITDVRSYLLDIRYAGQMSRLGINVLIVITPRFDPPHSADRGPDRRWPCRYPACWRFPRA
jgi:hypothetical protein